MSEDEILELFVYVEPKTVLIDGRFKLELAEVTKQSCQVLYVMKNAFDLYKIGITNDPLTRLKQVIFSSGIPTDLLAIWYVSDARAYEKHLHYYYSNYRTIGEWFNFSTMEDALDCICNLIYRMAQNNGTYRLTDLGEDEWGADLP